MESQDHIKKMEQTIREIKFVNVGLDACKSSKDLQENHILKAMVTVLKSTKLDILKLKGNKNFDIAVKSVLVNEDIDSTIKRYKAIESG